MQAWRCDDLCAIGLEIQPGAGIKFAQRAIERKIMMGAFASAEGHCGIRERVVGLLKVLQGEITAVAGVYVEDG
jgi:hypothetical protein